MAVKIMPETTLGLAEALVKSIKEEGKYIKVYNPSKDEFVPATQDDCDFLSEKLHAISLVMRISSLSNLRIIINHLNDFSR